MASQGKRSRRFLFHGKEAFVPSIKRVLRILLRGRNAAEQDSISRERIRKRISFPKEVTI
jgi:hypothetical protein